MSERKLPRWIPRPDTYNPIQAGSIDGTDTEPHDRAISRALNADYQPDPHIRNAAEFTVFIARLNVKTSESRLKDVFSEFGRIRKCKVVRDIVSGFSKGYAFIEYESRSSVALALKANEMELQGRKIFVDRECQRMPGWVPRRMGGGFGGDKKSGQLRYGGRDRPFRRPILDTKTMTYK